VTQEVWRGDESPEYSDLDNEIYDLCKEDIQCMENHNIRKYLPVHKNTCSEDKKCQGFTFDKANNIFVKWLKEDDIEGDLYSKIANQSCYIK